MKYDKDKKGISKNDLLEIMKALMEDECIIGKVPNLQNDEVSYFLFGFNVFEYRFQQSLTLVKSLKKIHASGSISEII